MTRAAARGYRGAVSPFARVVAVTAAAAVAAVAVVVGVVALQTDPVERAAPAPQARKGAPPLTFELGVRADPRRSRSAAPSGSTRRASGSRRARAFARIDSVEGRVGQAFASWPDGTVDRLNRLAGAARAGRRRAAQPRRRALLVGPPGRAGGLACGGGLGARTPPTRSPPATSSIPSTRRACRSSSRPRRCRARSRAWRPPRSSTCCAGARTRTRRGQAPVRRRAAAARAAALGGARLRAAAREAPGDAEAQVAAAVGRFDKARPADAFSRLGPLTRRFPDTATVRFHLGLLLLWSGEVKEARTQLVRATTVEPGSPLALEARKYLDTLDKAGV